MSDPCLTCPLPDCDEDDPRCPLRHQHGNGQLVSEWQAELEQLARLADGERVRISVPQWQVKRLQDAISHQCRQGKLPPMRTRRHLIYGEGYELEVERCDDLPARRWSKWSEYLDVVERLAVGEECSFVVSTPYDLKLLQQTVYQWHRFRDVRARTRRESGERLTLYVTREV